MREELHIEFATLSHYEKRRTHAAGSSVTPRRERENALHQCWRILVYSLSLSPNCFIRLAARTRQLGGCGRPSLFWLSFARFHHCITLLLLLLLLLLITWVVCLPLLLLWSCRDAYSLKRREVALLNKKKEQYCSALLWEDILECSLQFVSYMYNSALQHERSEKGWRRRRMKRRSRGRGALWFNSKFETTRLGPSREGTLSLSLWFAYVYMYSANKVLSAMHVIHIQSRRQQT